MCEKPKMPKICNYNRDKKVNNQNVVIWNQKHQKHKASILARNSDFRYIAKISRHSEIGKFRYEQ